MWEATRPVSVQPEPAPPAVRSLDPLLALQGVDLAIDRLVARLSQLEAQAELRGARERASETEERVGALKLAIDDVATQQRRFENDIDSIERKIDAERKRLFDGSVANPKELQAIEHEVASLLDRKGRMEDLALEQMERREELEGRLGPTEGEASDTRARLAEIESTSARELVESEAALAERRTQRAAIASGIDPEVLELYEDLRRQKKGVGAAALVDGVCQGCHQKLSPVYLDRLKRDPGIRRCEYCRRILVY